MHRGLLMRHFKQTNTSGPTNGALIGECQPGVSVSDWQPNVTSQFGTPRVPRQTSGAGVIFSPKKYSKEELLLGALARKMAMHRDVLYHGTRYAQSILSMGVLFSPDRKSV